MSPRAPLHAFTLRTFLGTYSSSTNMYVGESMNCMLSYGQVKV